VLDRIAQAMRQTLQDARQDARVPASLLQAMDAAWETGLQYAP
jgi:serine/threonine-protein kinase HipA